MIYTVDEWSSLKRVVVGTATNANWPVNDPIFNLESEKTLWKETPVPRGPVAQRIVDESNEDLDTLAEVLTGIGVEVLRPTDIDFVANDGMYNYCPRDRLLVHGSTVIDTAMMYPCRDMEREALSFVYDDAERVITMPRDQGLVLDAANVLRLGKDKMLFLESASGNILAYNWLCQQLPDVKIELCNFYAGVHIDSTIVPLREGLVMLNASRVNYDNCPRVFDDWEKIWIDDVIAQDFYQYPYASKWIALNMLIVDPNTVVVDQEQSELILTLMKYNFTVIPRKLRHSRTLGGGFHCVTLDLLRNGNK